MGMSPTYMGLVIAATIDFLISVHPETIEDTCGEWKRFKRIKIWLLLMSPSLLTTNQRKGDIVVDRRMRNRFLSVSIHPQVRINKFSIQQLQDLSDVAGDSWLKFKNLSIQENKLMHLNIYSNSH